MNNGSHSNGNSNNNNQTSTSSSSNKKGNVDYVKSFIKTSNGTFLPAPTTSIVSTSANSGTSSVVSTAPVTSTSINLDTASDINSVTDNVVAVTQLREKILSLDRQLKNKNQELLKKDVKVCLFVHFFYILTPIL